MFTKIQRCFTAFQNMFIDCTIKLISYIVEKHKMETGTVRCAMVYIKKRTEAIYFISPGTKSKRDWRKWITLHKYFLQ